jgi:uncharacterized membrane protein (GlpM family)
MRIQFQLRPEDYNLFLKRLYFQKDLGKRLLFLIVFSLFIGASKPSDQPYELSIFIIKTLIAGLAFFLASFLIPFLIAKMRLRKALVSRPITEFKTLSIHEDGVNVTSVNESSFWRWETLKSAEIVNGFLYFTLFTNKYYLIPINSFPSDNEAINFLGVLKNGVFKVRGQSIERKVHNLYYWGLVGFIPNFGLIAGVVLAVKGFNYRDNKLIAIGIACILFTVLFWTVIMPFLIHYDNR